MFKPIQKSVEGIANSRLFVSLIYLVFSLFAMLASFMLSIEALFEARHPNTALPCDINAVLSCSTVAASEQAEILGKIIQLPGEYSVPNAFLGMIFEAVFITIGALMLSHKTKFPKWFMTASQIGNLFALGFAYWLFYQSSFVIGALCPWCMLLMSSTTVQFFAQLQFNILNKSFPLKEPIQEKWQKFVSNGFQWMILIIILLIIVMIVILKYGSRLITG